MRILSTDVPDVPAGEAEWLIRTAMAQASLVAPCVLSDDLTPEQVDQFTAVLSTAVNRWYNQGAGAVTSETRTGGPFTHTVSQDTRAAGFRGQFTHGEKADLRAICGLAGVVPRGKFPEVRARPW